MKIVLALLVLFCSHARAESFDQTAARFDQASALSAGAQALHWMALSTDTEDAAWKLASISSLSPLQSVCTETTENRINIFTGIPYSVTKHCGFRSQQRSQIAFVQSSSQLCKVKVTFTWSKEFRDEDQGHAGFETLGCVSAR